MMQIRRLAKAEIPLIWTIDRAETHENIYKVVHDDLRPVPSYFEMTGWPPEQIEQDTPMLQACFDRGGVFIGTFEQGTLTGVAVVDMIPLGVHGEQLQLKYFYVSRPYRGQRIGRRLFEAACEVARAKGAKYLYISSIPTQNTVDFYLRMGAVLNPAPDAALFAQEPDDIHLLCPL